MKFKALFFLLCLLPCAAFSEDDLYNKLMIVKNEIKQINSSKLEKYTIRNTQDQESAFIYLDQNHKIRKYICKSSYPEGRQQLVQYYSENGNLVHMLYWTSWALLEHGIESFTSRGTFSFVDGILFKINNVSYYDFLDRRKKREITQNIIPEKTYFSFPSTISELCSTEKIDITKLPKNKFSGFCSFRAPLPKEITLISVNDVFFRKAPSTNSESFSSFETLDTIRIISVGETEQISIYGNNPWYQVWNNSKIEYASKGYVYGAFVEPVEYQIDK